MYNFFPQKISRAGLPPTAPKKEEHHLFLKFSALALPVNEPCDLLFFLYDGKLNKVLRCVKKCLLERQRSSLNITSFDYCFEHIQYIYNMSIKRHHTVQ